MTQPETEEDRLRRECREMYADLHRSGAIEGTFEEWLADATKKAALKLDPNRIIVPT